jgi:hypothetical protein
VPPAKAGKTISPEGWGRRRQKPAKSLVERPAGGAGEAGNRRRPPGRRGTYFVATVLPLVSLMVAHLVWIRAFRESGSET